ncbi:UNKNOWN [Stylonychia lemnae]|uniref:Uncharacterized protein n=1 Tax=Stylonychia lemnae TaxID=5949 RepID=A0A077ZN45_STYLE|nr:UNKNOWN [Stylonychia lemnae]|eukprot:CDW71338.1 UNKNOWN [Stylonychia lemnae]
MHCKDFSNQIQSPVVQEFLNGEVDQYFSYREQQRKKIRQVKADIQSINGDLKQAIIGSSTTDYLKQSRNRKNSVYYSTSNGSISTPSIHEYQSRLRTAATALQPLNVAKKTPFLVQASKTDGFPKQEMKNTGFSSFRNQTLKSLDSQERDKFEPKKWVTSSPISDKNNKQLGLTDVIIKEKTLNQARRQKQALKHLLELQNRIININSKFPQAIENKIQDSKNTVDTETQINIPRITQFKKVENQIQKRLLKSKSSINTARFENNNSVLQQLKTYDTQVKDQIKLKKELDSIISIALNKKTRIIDKRPIARQVHMELNDIFTKEEIQDVGEALKEIDERGPKRFHKNYSSEQLAKTQMKHLNKDNYLQFRHYDSEILGNFKDESSIQQNIDDIDAIDVEFYKFKYRYQAQVKQCKNQEDKDKLNQQYLDQFDLSLLDQQKISAKEADLLKQLYLRINHHIMNI